MLHKIALVLCLLICWGLFQGYDPALAAEPWQLEADLLEVDEDQGWAEASGDVHIWRGEDYIRADYARLYLDTDWIYLESNIDARFEGDFIEGEEAELNLEEHVGWIKDGQVFIAEDNVYVSGEHLEKTGPHTYTFEQGVMTSCDARPAPWSIKSSRGEITVDGYARLWHPRFRVRDNPVMYSPYTIAPVKTERQSGFLFPDMGYGSEYGFNINLPYYWAIDNQRDMTFYANSYSQRGFMPGVEYRHTPRLHAQGLWRLDWMRDSKVHQEGDQPDRFQDDDLERTNQDRYWLRGMFDHYDPATEWSYRVDIDYVSDQYYLREFDSGPSGYRRSRDEFLDVFGRDIREKDSTTRRNILSASRGWSRFGLETRLEYTDNLEYKTDNIDENTTVQRLPEINLDMYRTHLGDTPFRLKSDNQAVYFWRRHGTTGTRMDVHPKLSLPLESRFGTLTPEVGWRQTGYYVDHFHEDNDDREDYGSGEDTENRFQSRGMHDLKVEADTEFFRVFRLAEPPEPVRGEVGESRWTGIRHTVTPELEYEYIPEVDQEDYPYFDGQDDIAPKEEMKFTLDNVFTRRSETVVGGVREDPEVERDYRDFLRVKLEQPYDLRTDEFEDFLAESTVDPNQYLTFENKTWYSHDVDEINRHEHTLTLTWPDNIETWFELDYRRDDHNILELGTEMDFISNWGFDLTYKRDLEENVDLERRLGIRYEHQCYGLEFIAKDTDYDYSFEFQIHLLNLGSWGF